MSNHTLEKRTIFHIISALYFASLNERSLFHLFKELLPPVVYQERNIIFLELLYSLLTPRNTEGC